MTTAFAGGVLIGLSALALYATLGRIAGISGILFGALAPDSRHWRLPFLLGLVAGGWAGTLASGLRPDAPLPAELAGLLVLVAAGLLVGAGTRLANGCTSGHGICGLARLSRRSLVAVAVFMGLGMLSASVLREALS